MSNFHESTETLHASIIGSLIDFSNYPGRASHYNEDMQFISLVDDELKQIHFQISKLKIICFQN